MENSTLEKLLIQLQKDFRNTVEILKKKDATKDLYTML